jgi:hypothetical protein
MGVNRNVQDANVSNAMAICINISTIVPQNLPEINTATVLSFFKKAK